MTTHVVVVSLSQSYSPGFPTPRVPAHETADRYIGDFNNANMTNIYIVRGDGKPETYTAFFAAAGFRCVSW